MLHKWYVPSWCGDYQLEADGEDASVLKVKDLNEAEVEQVTAFLKKARKKGLISELDGLPTSGEGQVKIKASVADAGKLFLGRKAPRKGILTCVKSVKGEIETVLGDDPEKLDEATKKDDAKEAVTTKRPTLCCPVPVPGPEQRASRVLESFCTARQWDEWTRRGYLHCNGSLSGHTFRIAHRHSPIAVAQGKVTWDVTADNVIHAHCSDLPPSEEVLTMKLTLEHAEHWIVNASGNLCGSIVYPNPFMSKFEQGGDGLKDAAYVRRVGRAVKNILKEL